MLFTPPPSLCVHGKEEKGRKEGREEKEEEEVLEGCYLRISEFCRGNKVMREQQ